MEVLDIESLVCELYPPESQQRVFQDIRTALEKYPYLVTEQSETVLSHHGNIEKALSLCGPIRIHASSTTYFVPLICLFPPHIQTSPQSVTSVQQKVTPQRDLKKLILCVGTVLVKSHNYMDHEGLCTSSIIQNWRNSSTFIQFIDSLVTVFGVEPPVQEAPLEESSYTPSSPISPSTQQIHEKVKPDHVLIDLEPIEAPPEYSASKLPLLEQKLKEVYSKFSVTANNSIDDLLKEGESLQSHSSRLDNHINALQHDIQRQNECIKVFSDKIQGLKQWIEFETAAQKNRSIDEMIQCNELDMRLLNTVAEDAAYEDCLFILRQELHKNNIDFESFAKQIRSLGRKQFFSRAMANKIVQSKQL